MKWCNNQIILGDQRDILEQMSDYSINTILTDPPYYFKNNLSFSDEQKIKDVREQEKQAKKIYPNNNWNGRAHILRKSNQIIRDNLNKKINWDSNLQLWKRKCKYINYFIFCNQELLFELITILNTKYPYYKKHIFTMYKHMANNISQHWLYDKEYCLYIYKNNNYKHPYNLKIPKDRKDYHKVHIAKNVIEGNWHPTPKSIEFCKWLIYNRVPDNFNIFDPYAGSGNILKAGQQLHHKVMGCEILEKYQKRANKELQEVNQSFIIEENNETTEVIYD